MSPITEPAAKPEKIKEPAAPKLKEPAFKAVRFKSQLPNTQYTIVPKYTTRERDPLTFQLKKTVSQGKYLFTDRVGETQPIDDPEILGWYLKPENVSYRYEMTCIWPGKEKPRDFGRDIGEDEKKRIEDIIAWKKAGG